MTPQNFKPGDVVRLKPEPHKIASYFEDDDELLVVCASSKYGYPQFPAEQKLQIQHGDGMPQTVHVDDVELVSAPPSEKPKNSTLFDLNVQPGDVVGCWNTAHKGTEFTIPAFWTAWAAATLPWWRIVRRNADTPVLWRDMTPEQKGALLLAHYEMKVIECVEPDNLYDSWSATGVPQWADEFAYRVKPEPKPRRVALIADSQIIGTIDLIDGTPDFTSIITETQQ